MPTLPVYESPMASRGLQPSSLGVESAEMEGHAWNSMFHELGDTVQKVGNAIDRHNAVQDTSQNNLAGAQAMVALQKSMDDTFRNADPAKLDEAAENWRGTTMEQILEKIGADNASPEGQANAENIRSHLRDTFTTMSMAQQSHIAGEQTVTNLDQVRNNLSQLVSNNPLLMNNALDFLHGSIEDQLKAHRLDPDTAANVRKEYTVAGGRQIGLAAFHALAERNPDVALSKLEAGDFSNLFSGTDIDALREFAGVQKRAQLQQLKSDDEEFRRQQSRQANSTATAITATMVQPDGSLAVPKDYYNNVLKLAQMPGVEPGMVRSMIDMGRSLTRELAEGRPAITDPHAYQDFRDRITLSADDPNGVTDEQLIRARADGLLNDKGYNFFRNALTTMQKDPAYKVAQTQFKTFLKGIRSSITNSNVLASIMDGPGDQRFLQFTQQATDEFEQAYKAGNWRHLLDRSQPHSLWHQAVPFMQGMKGSEAELQNRSSGGSVGLAPSIDMHKRQPGETIDEFNERTRGLSQPRRQPNESPAEYLQRLPH